MQLMRCDAGHWNNSEAQRHAACTFNPMSFFSSSPYASNITQLQCVNAASHGLFYMFVIFEHLSSACLSGYCVAYVGQINVRKT